MNHVQRVAVFVLWVLSAVGSVAAQRTKLSPPGGKSRLLFGEIHRMLPPEAFQPEAIVLGDVDGDGDLDAIVLPIGVAQNRLYLNDGSGVFSDATANLPSVSEWSRAAALGDVDADGDLDLVIGNMGAFLPSGRQDRLLLNDGNGLFSDATVNLPAVSDATTSVGLGDVDGDGDIDLLVGNEGDFFGGEQNRLALNDGCGFFSDATSNLPTRLDNTYSVEFADVDNDGDLDAFIGTGAPVLYRNDGTGVFVRRVLGFPRSEALAVGDVDGDGYVDVLLGRGGPFPEQNELWLNDGAGRFDDETTNLPTALDTTWDVALVDVEGDGDLDALIANDAGEENRLYLNGGTGVFDDESASIPSTLGDLSRVLAIGDVDGDLDLDVIVGTEGQDRLHLNDGAGAFGEVVESFDARGNTLALALGDVDGDGDLDLLAGNGYTTAGNNPGDDRLYLNDGFGAFVQSSGLPMTAGFIHTNAVVLADVDGDGDLDALLGNYGVPSENGLLLNDGTGLFSDASANLPAIGDETQDLAVGDLDGDGDLDVVIANGIANLQQNRLYVNDGAGLFTDATANLPTLLEYTYVVELGDVDGDGDLDIVFGNGRIGAPGRVDHLYLNNGGAVFTDASNLLPDQLEKTFALDLGDVDGDGDLDLLVGNYGTQFSTIAQNRLYLNDGTGFFSDATANLPAVHDITFAVALADVDLDGDLDAWIGNSYAGSLYPAQNRLHLNDGSGVFTDASSLLPPVDDLTRAIALGDVDGDGDLDCVTGNRWRNRVVHNLGRQLAWRGEPRIGKPLVFDIYGPTPGGWILELPGANLLSWGSFGADGHAVYATAIPPWPSLVGFRFTWRVSQGPPFRTLREETRVTDF